MRACIGLVLLLGMALPAATQQVIWKCEEARGRTVYQNAPCAAGQVERQARTYHTPDSPRAVAERRRVEQEMERRNAAARRPGLPQTRLDLPSARERKRQECAQAREAASRAAFDRSTQTRREWLERRAIDACFGL